MGNLWSDIIDVVKPLAFYSDEELSELREEYRLLHCEGVSVGTSMIEAIDHEMHRRHEKKYGPVDPSTFPHREHGWYLSNDD